MAREEDNLNGIEIAMRTGAGLGLGYAAIHAYRSDYQGMKRSFLGMNLSPTIKRAFTRIWQFSGEFFEHINMEKSLSLPIYMQEIKNDFEITRVIEEINRKRSQIQDIFLGASDAIENIRATALVEGINPEHLVPMLGEFSTFRNNYFGRALWRAEVLTESTFKGRSAAVETGRLESLRVDELESINQQLKIVRDRARQLEYNIRGAKNDIQRIVNLSTSKMGGVSEQRTSEIITDKMQKIRERIDATTRTIGGLADLRPTSNPVPQTPNFKFWTIGGDIRDLKSQISNQRLIGREGLHTISTVVKQMYDDPLLTKNIIGPEKIAQRKTEERLVRREFMANIRDSIRDLQRTGIFSSVEVGVTTEAMDEVVIRATKRGGGELLIPLAINIPKTEAGIRYARRGGKTFFQPFTKQRNILLEQSRQASYMLSDPAFLPQDIDERVKDSLDSIFDRMMLPSKTTLVDAVQSAQVNQRLTHQESELFMGAWDSFRKIQKVKMGRGSILHIDLEGDQIGWSLMDWKGQPIDGYHFAIGTGAVAKTPTHLRSKSLGGHNIVQEIGENELDKVVDALHNSIMKSYGKPIRIASKAYGLFDKEKLNALLTEVDKRSMGGNPKISALKAALSSENVIEINNLPRMNGETLQVKGVQLFRIMSRHLRNKPKLRAQMEQLVKKVGIPSFDEIGQMVVEQGHHTAFMDAYMQGIYVEFTRMLQKKDRKSIEREFKKIKDGFLPDRLTVGLYHSELSHLRRLNVSPSASIHGKLDTSGSMLTNPFPDQRPGHEYRQIPSMQLRSISDPVTRRRIQDEYRRLMDAGIEPDLNQILKRELNEIHTKSLVLIDPGGTRYMAKDDFGFSDPLMKSSTWAEAYEEVVDKGSSIEFGIKEGAEVSTGGFVGLRRDEPIAFKSRKHTQKGIVTSIIDNKDGTETIVINRINKLGWGIPVVVGGSQAATVTRSMDDYLPHIGGDFSSFRLAAYAEKNNPGAVMSDMLALMFHHSGMGPNAIVKNDILTKIIMKKMGADPKDARRTRFPMVRDTLSGMMKPDVRGREYWYENFKDMDIGKIVEISEEYKRQVTALGDSFTGSRLVFDEIHKVMGRSEIRETQDKVLRSYGMLMGQKGYIEANVKIASHNMGRPISESAIKSRVNDVRRVLESGDVKSAIALMRNDIKIGEVDDILEQLPAHFGFARHREDLDARLTWSPATVSWDSVVARDFDTMSGLGELKQLNISMATLEQLSPLRDSKGLLDILRTGIYKSDPIKTYRMFPFSFLSSKETLSGFRRVSRNDVTKHLNKFLDRWMSLPETTRMGNFNGWIPKDAVYNLNGSWMTREAAQSHYGMTSIEFDEAVRDGKATLVDPTVLKSRLRVASDVDQMRRTSMQPFSVEFGRDARLSVEARWSKTNVNIERLLITQASREDYFPVDMVGPGGKKQRYLIESPIQTKTREVLRHILSGAFVNPRDGNTGGPVLQELMDLYQDYTVKLNLKTSQATSMVPVVRFHGSTLFTDLPQLSGGVTTKEEAMKVMMGVFGTKEMDSKMFLRRRGVMPRKEGFIVGVNERDVDKWIGNVFSTLSSDDIKAMANRFLGNVKLGNKSGVNPSLYTLRHMAEFGPADGKNFASNALGMIQNIASSKVTGDAARKGWLDLVLKGVTPLSMGGLKFPLADQGKFVGEDFYKAMAYGQDRKNLASRMAIGGSPVGVMPSAAMFQGTIDTDGDFLAFMLGEGVTEKVLKIMKSNTFFSEINPIAQVVGTEKGMVQLYDTVNNEFIKRPMGVTTHFTGLNKAESLQAELWTKQAAGKITIFSENIGQYMSRVLSHRGSGLATDLGQETMSKMRLQLRECMGALIEGGALKGKSSSSAGSDAMIEFFDRLSHESGVKEFMGEVETIVRNGDPSDVKVGMFKKLLSPIVGLQNVFEGTKGMDFGDVMIQAARGGRALGSLSAEEILVGTSHRAKDTYKGQMVDAMRNILPDIPTHFTPWKQEGVLTAMKRNITNDLSEQQWRKVSKGMGWAAAAGAVFLASNMFRSDDNQFLGDRPGFGGEARDFTFTRPEYEMGGLLDTPYKNPWSKSRAYVTMANPSMNQKMQQLSRKEEQDIRTFHEVMGLEKTRVSSSFNYGKRDLAGYRQLLERYGQ